MTCVRRVMIGAAMVVCLGLTPLAPAQDTNAQEMEADIAFARRLSSAFKHAAERIEPSVVHITLERQVYQRDRFGRVRPGIEPDLQRSGLGSGVIADARGYVLTNNHVIQNADEFVVRLADGREYSAELVGTDPPTDLAVLLIDAEGLVPAQFGDSEALEVGEWVLAAGSPFGFANSITAGIVSAKGRSEVGGSRESKSLQEFIQTDAAINPGNSGGPLVDLTGRVVGINTAIASRSGGNVGLGFAIPADIAQSVMAQIIEAGRVNRGWLGVAINELEPERTIELGIEFGIEGGIVLGPVIEGSPADLAGLREGDVVTSFAGRATTSPARLRNAIALTGPGSRAIVTYLRNGKPGTAEVTVIDRNAGERLRLGAAEIGRLGIVVAPDQIVVFKNGRQTPGPRGLVVLELDPGGLGAIAGFQAGDLITGVDGEPVSDPDELNNALRVADLERGVRLNLMRANARQRGYMRGYIDVTE